MTTPATGLLQSEIDLLKAQRSYLLVALSNIAEMLSHHPEVARGNTHVHFAYYRAMNAVREVAEG